MLRSVKVLVVVVGAIAMGMGCSSDGEADDPNGPGSGSSGSGEPGSSGATDRDASTAADAAPGRDGAVGDAGECSLPCGLGTRACQGNAVVTCEASASCNAFSAPVDCPADTFCTAGQCSDTCTDACPTLGVKECAGSGGLRECVMGAGGCRDWSVPVACGGSLVCSGGSCGGACTDQCSSGASKCADGASRQTCETQASGCLDWSAPAACAGGGSCTGAGACGTCVDGTQRCGATGNVEICNAAAWTESGTCAFGCTGGACNTAVACTAGNYRCNGLSVEVCNATGSAYLQTSTCAVACEAGLCTGACTPGETRCNQNGVETCAASGAAWTVTEACATSCDATSRTCVVPSLDIAANTSRDGVIVVSGAVIVRAGATLSVPSGSLEIRADSITVELDASIIAAATGSDPALVGSIGGSNGCSSYGGGAGRADGGINDAVVGAGGRGGRGGTGTSCTATLGGTGGAGGGVIRLIAKTITVAGTVTANGKNGEPAPAYYTSGGGGGAGGGILLAGDVVTLSGTASAAPGAGGNGYTGSGNSSSGTTGGQGRVKILAGTRNVSGTVLGIATQGLLPPLSIASSTHPVQSLLYNDDFAQAGFGWNRPTAQLAGYYVRLSPTTQDVPTPATGIFNASEIRSYARSAFAVGVNWLHIAPVTPASEVGLVENRFAVTINATPPAVSSSSHPNSALWTDNDAPFFAWSMPIGDQNFRSFHYVFDHYGDTIPTRADATLPVSQKSKVQPAVAPGVWAMHVISEDTHGYLTKKAGHYVVRVGANPGAGTLLGTVTASNGGAPIDQAELTINRSLLVAGTPNQKSNAAGSYNFPQVPAGTWELTVSAAGFASKTVVIVVQKDGSTMTNVALDP